MQMQLKGERQRKKGLQKKKKKDLNDFVHLKRGTIANIAADKLKVQKKKKKLTLISMSAEVSGGCEAMAFE